MKPRSKQNIKVARKSRIRIDTTHRQKICEFLSSSSRALTWDEIVEQVENSIGFRWTRQALSRHKEIQDAYNKMHSVPVVSAIDPAIQILSQKLSLKDEELDRLRQSVRDYQEMFVRYHHHAYMHGLSPEDLNKPLPAIADRRSHPSNVEKTIVNADGSVPKGRQHIRRSTRSEVFKRA